MKRSLKTIIASGTLLSAVVLAGSLSPAFAEEEKPTADLSVAFLSQYVWRGFQLSHDSLVIQPSMTVAYKGFSANLWGNLDTDYYGYVETKGETGGANLNETDVTLAYDGSVGALGYGVGYIYYALDDGFLDEQEIYAGISYDTILSPSLKVYRDFAHTLGWYVQAGVSHSIPLTEKISLDLGATASYLSYDQDVYFPLNGSTASYDGGFHDGVISASVTFPLIEYVSVTPLISYSFPLSSDAKDYLEYTNAKLDQATGDADTFYGGVSVSFSF